IELPPELPAAAALQRILRELREVMQQNEPGVIADIDSEFLHDFRVAVRRTRSALGQLKGVFAAERLAQFRSDFAEIGKATNLLRDLDVYLLDRRHYEAMLPETLQGALAPLFTHLEAER
ncbi:MAG: CHAD domain-containing protein, partial [Calditrichaeota bacterium]|nr:CHAD domain-containing protein [Calditrichota bacterium]